MYIYIYPRGAIRARPTRAQGSPQGPSPQGPREAHKGPALVGPGGAHESSGGPTSAQRTRAQGGQKDPANKGPGGSTRVRTERSRPCGPGPLSLQDLHLDIFGCACLAVWRTWYDE